MGGMKITKICDAPFVGDDGKKITDTYVYLVSADGSFGTERVFLSDEKLSNMEYTPKFGDTVYLFQNVYGSCRGHCEALSRLCNTNGAAV